MSSGKLKNIGGDPNDPAYRYKMPRIQTKIEGRGNGIKTRLVNIVDVAKAIKRPPGYPTKFFGCELCAQARIDEKKGVFIVNGAFDNQAISDLLDLFIEKYVLCPECKLPETDLRLHKGVIYADCRACSYSGPVDMQHRLATYMIRNPPPKPESLTKSKSEPKQAAKEQRSEQVSLSLKEEDVVWHTDTSKEAVAARRKQELGHLTTELTQGEEEESEDAHLVRTLRSILDSDMTLKEKQASVRKMQKANRVGNEKRTILIFKACLEENPRENVVKYAEALQVFLKDPRTQRVILGCLAESSAKSSEALAELVHVLSGLYNNEIVEESVILEWADAEDNKYASEENLKKAQEAAEPFIEWLKNADEESSEEEEEEEE